MQFLLRSILLIGVANAAPSCKKDKGQTEGDPTELKTPAVIDAAVEAPPKTVEVDVYGRVQAVQGAFGNALTTTREGDLEKAARQCRNVETVLAGSCLGGIAAGYAAKPEFDPSDFEATLAKIQGQATFLVCRSYGFGAPQVDPSPRALAARAKSLSPTCQAGFWDGTGYYGLVASQGPLVAACDSNPEGTECAAAIGKFTAENRVAKLCAGSPDPAQCAFGVGRGMPVLFGWNTGMAVEACAAGSEVAAPCVAGVAFGMSILLPDFLTLTFKIMESLQGPSLEAARQGLGLALNAWDAADGQQLKVWLGMNITIEQRRQALALLAEAQRCQAKQYGAAGCKW